MSFERCFGCDNMRGQCFTERPDELFSVRAATRGALGGMFVGALLGGPPGVLWGGIISAMFNGLFGDRIDRKLRAPL